MNTDMDLITRWPQAVTLDLAVHYERSAPDRRTYRLAPLDRTTLVRVLTPQYRGAPLELQRMNWSALPGRTLYLRSLSVLAVHLFGEAAMPPRARGAPLWQHLSAGMSTDQNAAHQIYFELDAVDDAQAVLRYRCSETQPPVRRVVALDVLDADPLRALLRIGMARVRPVLTSNATPARSAPHPRHVHVAPEMAQQP